MKAWITGYQLLTTALMAIIWFCLKSHLNWKIDTENAIFEMLGFTREGTEIPDALVQNMTSPLLEEECIWDEDHFNTLPKPVQRYLHRAFLFTGEEERNWEDSIKLIRSVRWIEEGNILLQGEWVPYSALRYISASPLRAGFIWDAKITSANWWPLPYKLQLYTQNAWSHGKEYQRVKLFGVVPVHTFRDADFIHKGIGRLYWLAFSPIFPTSLLPHLTDGIHWVSGKEKKWNFNKKIESVAIVEGFYPAESESSKVQFHFDDQGLVNSIAGNGWRFRMEDYKIAGHGMLCPMYVELGREENGKFSAYMKVHIKDPVYSYF